MPNALVCLTRWKAYVSKNEDPEVGVDVEHEEDNGSNMPEPLLRRSQHEDEVDEVVEGSKDPQQAQNTEKAEKAAHAQDVYDCEGSAREKIDHEVKHADHR